jgi:hypothetical protein
MAHSSNISQLPSPACTWYSSWTFLTLKMSRLRCLQKSGKDYPFTQCHDTEERSSPTGKTSKLACDFYFQLKFMTFAS